MSESLQRSSSSKSDANYAKLRILRTRCSFTSCLTLRYKKDAGRRRSYKNHFEYTLNKLYVWNMLDYERVIYMDADNIFFHNIDSLFKCGHFCAVYMNPCNFHTGLFVVTPNNDTYNDLLKSLATLVPIIFILSFSIVILRWSGSRLFSCIFPRSPKGSLVRPRPSLQGGGYAENAASLDRIQQQSHVILLCLCALSLDCTMSREPWISSVSLV